MKSVYRLLPLLSVFALFGCQHPAPAPPPVTAPALTGLRSPWDSTPVSITDVPYDCGPIPHLSPELTVTDPIDSSKHHVSEDVKSAVYAESSTGVQDFYSRTVHAADAFRSTGSSAAAQCTITMLTTAAADHALTGYMSSKYAWYEQNHALRAFAIAYLKVRGANIASPQDALSITRYLDSLVRQERDHWERSKCNSDICYIKGHRGLQTAMAAAAIGIAANDNSLFHWATSQYRSAAGEINGRGMLHYDSRGHDAFICNLESAASMVQIAEFAEINGEPLYGYDNGIIHLLVHTVALGIVSPAPYAAAAHASQDVPKSVEPWEIAWASVYNRRFPDPVVTSLLQQIGPGGVDMWGGEPWDPEGDPGLDN